MSARLVLAGLITLLWTAGPAWAQPPVWVVRDADSELVLFGSLHVLPARLNWKPPALTRALAAADDLWFELPMDAASEAEVARLAAGRGAMPPGQSLFAVLSRADAVRLSRVAQAYGVAPALLDHLQPWMAEVVLSAATFRRSGANAADGAEKTIAAAAPPSAGRRAFETPAEQISLFADVPMTEQIASLNETLREMQDNPDQFAALLRDWMAGDMAALDREALQPLRKASPAMFRRLVSERNARWASVLDTRLKGRGRTVVVVGVGHLIGPDGVPARLRALGYSVEGP
jgi:uncharacterized protein YbaP (TraB family)